MAKNKMTSLNSHTQTGYTQIDDVSAKHSFMKNPELKAMTFFHLQFKNSNPSWDASNRYLLNAALTCKDFLHVALDALWEELDSLMPLLQVLPALPPALPLEDNYYYEEEEFVLSEIVSQADWDRFQYYSRKVKFFEIGWADDRQVHPSTYIRIAQIRSFTLFPSLRRLRCRLDWNNSESSKIFLFLSPLLESLELIRIKDNEKTIVGPFLASLPFQMLNRIVLGDGQMSADFLKKSIVRFKQLRSLELLNAVLMSDFVLWEVLGTLPSLADLTLKADHPTSHPARAPENLNNQSGGIKYFDALESLCVTGSFSLIQSLLGFIDSPLLKTIKVYPVLSSINPDLNERDYFTPCLTIVAFKWSQSLKNLVIDSSPCDAPYKSAISPKCLMLLGLLHEMQTFHLTWAMENMDDDVRCLVMSWPKLRSLELPRTGTQVISFSTLKIIAEYCPELRYLHISLNDSIPSFDISSKSLPHNLEVLSVGRAHPSIQFRKMLEYQIQVTRYLDFIFPYLKSLEVPDCPDDEIWSGIRDLVHLCQGASLSRSQRRQRTS